MNILLISPLPLPAGGIASWTKGYIESKISKENNVILVNTAVKGERVNKFSKIKIKDEIIRNINIIQEVRKKIKNEKIDVVHLNTSCSRLGIIRDYLISILVKLKKNKLLVHYHCDVQYMVNNNISRLLFKKLCKNADSIVVLNKSSEEYIKKTTGLSSRIIANFINFKVENNKKINSQIKKILYVGHVTKLKGCNDILEVAKKKPENEFILIGNISNEIDTMNKSQNVKLLGEVNKELVLEYMKEADLFLFPTHTEGFPNAVLEAMACGLPIISTGVGAIPDMIENKGGVIVKIGDILEIEKKIDDIKDLNIRKKMSDWNINKVKENYVLDLIMSKLMKEYERII